MHLEFDVDIEAEKVSILFDDAIVLSVQIAQDGSFTYRGFEKLDDDDVALKIKRFAKDLLF